LVSPEQLSAAVDDQLVEDAVERCETELEDIVDEVDETRCEEQFQQGAIVGLFAFLLF